MMLGLARNVRARAGISAARASIPTCASLSRRGLLLAPTYDRYIPLVYAHKLESDPLRMVIREAKRLHRRRLTAGFSLPSHEGPQFDAILVGAGFVRRPSVFGSPC